METKRTDGRTDRRRRLHYTCRINAVVNKNVELHVVLTCNIDAVVSEVVITESAGARVATALVPTVMSSPRLTLLNGTTVRNVMICQLAGIH